MEDERDGEGAIEEEERDEDEEGRRSLPPPYARTHALGKRRKGGKWKRRKGEKWKRRGEGK